MMGLKHPFTGAHYEQDGNGNIRVTDTEGVSGLFRINGSWIEGELRWCDPQLCNWVGGPKFANHRVSEAD